MSRKPRLKVVRPDDIEPDRPIMNVATAKKRFAVYLGIKLLGLAALFGGVFLGRDGLSLPAGTLLVLGTVSLFIRPKMLGLTTTK